MCCAVPSSNIQYLLQSKLNNSPQHRGAQHGGAAAAAVDMEIILVNVACPLLSPLCHCLDNNKEEYLEC